MEWLLVIFVLLVFSLKLLDVRKKKEVEVEVDYWKKSKKTLDNLKDL